MPHEGIGAIWSRASSTVWLTCLHFFESLRLLIAARSQINYWDGWVGSIVRNGRLVGPGMEWRGGRVGRGVL